MSNRILTLTARYMVTETTAIIKRESTRLECAFEGFPSRYLQPPPLTADFACLPTHLVSQEIPACLRSGIGASAHPLLTSKIALLTQTSLLLFL